MPKAYYFTQPGPIRPTVYKVNARNRTQAIIKLAKYETGKTLLEPEAFRELEALSIKIIITIKEV